MRTTRHGGLLVLLLSLMVVVVYYGAVLRAPGAYMFNTEGDGLKNYFSFAWHVEHDTSAVVFDGMNHPFGEHIDYPDAQPVLSNAWRALSSLVPAAATRSVQVVNLLMLLSMVLCPWLLYRIFRELGLPVVPAVLFALPVAFLAPQMLRGTMAHYALAYACCIPSVCLSALRLRRSERPWPGALALGLLVLFWLFVHVYLGFISGLFVLIAGGLWVLASRGREKRAWALAIAPALAMVVFFLWQKATDTHVDRTMHPTGFFIYQLKWSGLLAPDLQYASSLWTNVIGLPEPVRPEARNYLGLGTVLMLLVVLLVWSARAWRRRTWRTTWDDQDRLFLVGWVSAGLLTMLAFGLPFDPWWKTGLAHTPVIGQFRAPSRFGWALYFLATIWAVHAAWRLYAKATAARARQAAGVLLAVVAFLFFQEAHLLNRHIAAEVVRAPNYFDRDRMPEDMRAFAEAADRVEARAMATLPYFHNGAEELMIEADGPGLLYGQALAQVTGVPLMNSSLTRTGLGEVRELIAGMGPPWYHRSLAARFAPQDTILLFAAGTPLGRYDRLTLGRAEELLRIGDKALYRISAEQLFRQEAPSVWAAFEHPKDTLWPVGRSWADRPGAVVMEWDLEDRSAAHAHTGRGAYAGLKRDANIVVTLPAAQLDTSTWYMLSFWYYNRGPMRCHAFATIDEQDTTSGRGAWNHYTDPRFARTVVGDWSLVEIPFRRSMPNSMLRLLVTGEAYYTDSIYIDDVQLRPLATTVFRPDTLAGVLWYDNHPVQRVMP